MDENRAHRRFLHLERDKETEDMVFISIPTKARLAQHRCETHCSEDEKISRLQAKG